MTRILFSKLQNEPNNVTVYIVLVKDRFFSVWYKLPADSVPILLGQNP